MSSLDDGPESPRNAEPVSIQKPAIGTVVTRDTFEAVSRFIEDVSARDYPVVVVPIDLPPYLLESLEQAGAVIAEHDLDDPERAQAVGLLVAYANDSGYPGVLFHEDVSAVVDFEQSERKWENQDRFVVDTESHSIEPPASRDVMVAIPAFNEAGTIGDVVESALRYAPSVLVVDDGSRDETAWRAVEHGADIITHLENQGYGAALKTAFEEAARRDVDTLITLDGDGQHDPGDIPRLLSEFEDGAVDVVIGSRFHANGASTIPWYRRVGLAVINLLTNLSLGELSKDSWIDDTQSGFRAYNRKAIRTLASDGRITGGMGASTDILYHIKQENYEIGLVGVDVSYDVENSNTMHPIPHGLQLVGNIVRRTIFGRIP